MYSNRIDLTFDHVKPVTPATVDEYAKLRSELSGRDRLIMDCVFLAGLRPGELLGMAGSLGLRYCDIFSPNDGLSYLNVFWGKTMRFRRAYAFKPLVSKLSAQYTLSGAVDTDLVFPSKDGGAWTPTAYVNWLNRVFTPAVKNAGLRNVHVFDLRHGYADLTYRSGSGVRGLAEAMDITVQQTKVMYSKVINRPLTDVSIDPNVEIRKAIDKVARDKRGEDPSV